jgi:hypothetical protein
MEKIKGIQTLVLDVILAMSEGDRPVVSKREIKTELMKTSMRNLDVQSYPGDKTTKLDRALDQALFQLKKSGKIKTHGYGSWSPVKVKESTKYKPKNCRALIPEYLLECTSCGHREQKVSAVLPGKKSCPRCGHALSINLFRQFCPVRKTFIGDPAGQCELLHGTDYTSKTKRVDPMKLCYFPKKPTDLGMEYANRKLELYEKRQRQAMRPKHLGF